MVQVYIKLPPHIQNLELDQAIIEKYTLTDFYVNL